MRQTARRGSSGGPGATRFTASRRLLHVGLLFALIGIATLMARTWVPVAAAVPLLGVVLFAALEVLLPLPRRGRRTVGSGERLLMHDAPSVHVVLPGAVLPLNMELEDGLPEGLRARPASTTPWTSGPRGASMRYGVEAVRRGTHAFGPATIARRGWLGLFRHSAEIPIPTTVEVLPASARNLGVRVRPKPPARVGVTTNTMRRGPGDEFFALRAYQPGDNIADVNWKASARMNRIITNEFLPEEPPRYMVYVDTRATGSETGESDVFERSLELASVLIEALIEARAQVGLVTLSFHSVFLVPGSGQNQLSRLRHMIQQCAPGHPAPLGDLVMTSLAHLPARAEAVLVTSDIYDPTLRDAVLSLKARHGRVTLVAPAYPEAEGEDLHATAKRAASALLNAEQSAALADLVGYADAAAQWPPDEPITATLGRLGMTRRGR